MAFYYVLDWIVFRCVRVCVYNLGHLHNGEKRKTAQTQSDGFVHQHSQVIRCWDSFGSCFGIYHGFDLPR